MSPLFEDLEARELFSVQLNATNNKLTAIDSTAISTTSVDASGRSSGTWNGVAVATGTEVGTYFGGTNFTAADGLVYYTYAGDSDLSGDFNYDGRINADDYFVIDGNYYSGFTNAPATAPVDYAGTEGNDVIAVFLRDSASRISINGVESALAGYNLRLYGKGGDDKIVIEIADAARKITIDGGEGNDTLWGNDAAERIYGGGGDDLINGNGGRDSIYGEAGDDSIRGGGSSDMLDGGEGNDTLRGDAGNDNLCGGVNSDRLRGSDGNDRLEGGGGRDILAGEAGDDTVLGGAGNDVVHGGAGVDILRGGRDFDQIYISAADGDNFDPLDVGQNESRDPDILG